MKEKALEKERENVCVRERDGGRREGDSAESTPHTDISQLHAFSPPAISMLINRGASQLHTQHSSVDSRTPLSLLLF